MEKSIDAYNYFSPLFYRKVAMNINWKQGLFAAALLLSVSLLFVGCGKCKTDKAVADKSAGEIVGEEIDVIEVVPAQTPNAKTSDVKEQKAEAQTPPAMTPPATNPAPAADAPTNQTPEPAAADDAAPSSTTSDVTVSTSCSETTSDLYFDDNWESEPVIESETTSCCNYYQAESACAPACAPAVKACQPACDAAPACAPDPVCAPEPVCVPACTPACMPCYKPCRLHHLRLCRPCHICCRTIHRIRDYFPWRSACEPAGVSACMSACLPDCQSDGCTNGDCTGTWSNEQSAPADSSPNSAQPEKHSNKTTALPDSIKNDNSQRASVSTAIGSTPATPETPSIVLPEATK